MSIKYSIAFLPTPVSASGDRLHAYNGSPSIHSDHSSLTSRVSPWILTASNTFLSPLLSNRLKTAQQSLHVHQNHRHGHRVWKMQDELLHHRPAKVFDIPSQYLQATKHHLDSIEMYNQLYNESIQDPSKFWSKLASQFYWKQPFPTDSSVFSYNFDLDKGPVYTEWFKGGKTNICYNAIDRHLPARANQVALYYEPNDIELNDGQSSDPALRLTGHVTYAQLHQQICKLANILKDWGVKKGDIVTIYMSMVPELPVAMLACARIGAIHSVVFGGFSAESLATRLLNAKSKIILSCDGVMRGPKQVKLKDTVDEAIRIASTKNHVVEKQLVLQRIAQNVDMLQGRDFWWHQLVQQASVTCEPLWMDAEDPLFVLFTSGSTGQPKGLLHTTGGYMVYTATTFKYSFNYQEGDVFFCTADCGWITGHSYLTYGPLLNGASQVIFEGVPTFPDAGRFWAIIDKYKVSQFYTAPTALRSLERAGNDFVLRYSRKSLRILGTVGEPIDEQTWLWYFNIVGNKQAPIVDTWWQTETGGHMIVPLPCKGQKMKPGSASLPFFGCQPVILDDQGNELEGEAEGLLMLKSPWPSMARTVFGDPTRYEQVYFSLYKGYYMTGDGCRRDADGYIWLTGRVDDILNVSGHRIGTAEVETALTSHPDVVEAAVVGVKHDIKGEGIYAYVTLMQDAKPSDQLKKELVQTVRKEIGPIATPETIHWASAVPKTRSGKIMRRILRKIANQGPSVTLEELGDISTLADPSVVSDLINSYGK